jgi:hypothetical protein
MINVNIILTNTVSHCFISCLLTWSERRIVLNWMLASTSIPGFNQPFNSSTVLSLLLSDILSLLNFEVMYARWDPYTRTMYLIQFTLYEHILCICVSSRHCHFKLLIKLPWFYVSALELTWWTQTRISFVPVTPFTLTHSQTELIVYSNENYRNSGNVSDYS